MNTATDYDLREFRNALGSFTTGVTIITARAEDGTPVGITANSFNSVSLDPPMVLWSLAKTSRSLAVFAASRHWAVHILSADQECLSNRFAKSGADKFAGLDACTGIANLPLLEGCTTRLQCETSFMYEGGDHLIFVGRVLDFDRNDLPPLAFQAGKYAVVTRRTNSVSPQPQATLRPRTGWSEDHVAYLLGRAYFQIYGRIREQARLKDLSEAEYFTLATLIVQDGSTLAQLNAVFSYSGSEATPELIHNLAARGLLRSERDSGITRHRLTDQGRSLTLQVIAAAEAIEADVLGTFGNWDAAALKNLLRLFIRQTDPGLPDLWGSGT